ncbi:hypothetical protein BKI52_09760 [marine bacterium AO1-C]|nr:hypothetical protein BKI52_09760 [marine bacterium AO1-C]
MILLMDTMQKLLFGLVFLFGSWSALLAQNDRKLNIPKKGLPLMKNYALADYPMLSHNYQIVQDSRGIIFIANNNGLIEFDGINWRQHQTPEQTSLKAVACINDKIYVGGNGMLGYFIPDKQANFTFVSLASQIKRFQQPLPIFTKIVATSSQVVFFSSEGLYIYNIASQKFKHIAPQTKFLNIFQSEQRVFVQESKRGLFLLHREELKFVEGSEIIASKKVQCFLSYNQKQILIGTQYDGIYVYNGQTFSEWNKLVNTTLKSTQLYTGIRLSPYYFAFATLDNGLLLLDSNGNIIQKISKRSGLPSNVIFSLFLDYQQRLWLGFTQGITQIDIFSPLRVYNEKLGLSGIPYDAIQFKEDLYIGTSQGIFKRDAQSYSGQFIQLPKSNGLNRSFAKVTDQYLLSGHSKCVFEVQGNKVSPLSFRGNVIQIAPLDTANQNVWLMCTDDGLYKANFIQQGKSTYAKVKGVKMAFDELSRVVPDANGFVWTSNANNGVVRLKLTDQADSVTNIRFYGKTNGLPSFANNRVFYVQKQVVIATKKGIFQYNATKDKFELHPLTEQIGEKSPILWISEDANKNIWVLSDRDIIVLEKTANQTGYRKKVLFHDIVKLKQSPFIHFLDKQNALFSVSDQLLSYDLTYATKQDTSFTALIRLVEWERAAGQDSILFGGEYQSKNAQTVYNYKINDFRFTVASSYLPFKQPNQFQFFLEGYDQEWSGWAINPTKEYTNLPAGDYVFRVKVRNNKGTIGKIASFKFTIRAAWYLTNWMNIVILLLIALLFVLFFWWNAYRLRSETERLETLVSERTEEITKQRDKVQASFQKLEEQRGDLIYKNVKLEQQQEVIMAQAESLQETLEELQVEKKEKEEALKLVEERNHYYTSGIRYAETIQKAILPDENVIKSVLDDYFILYRPKDIVSGDFYWFSHISENVYEQITGEKNKSITFIAVIDCTGHGVPGAFMSMIGNTLLNEIVNQRHFFDPVRVLEMLNIKIRLSLKQEETYNVDGMDVCFCRLEKLQGGKQTLVSFTGARRPLYYKISEDTPLKELRGDRKVIGGLQRKKRVFTNQELLLESGGALYLTTDGLLGLCDPAGQKFGSLQMKDFFDKHAHLPMTEQKTILLDKISSHQKDAEQRDDMTIMGIRV